MKKYVIRIDEEQMNTIKSCLMRERSEFHRKWFHEENEKLEIIYEDVVKKIDKVLDYLNEMPF